MSNIICRTNSDVITFHVSCIDGERHKVKFNASGSLLEYSHDVADDEVIQALGGSLPPCATARNIFTAAKMYLAIFQGAKDCDDLVSLNGNLWKDSKGVCDTCYSRGTDIKHFNSIKHIAGKCDAANNKRQVSAAVKWLAEHNDVSSGRITNVAELEEFTGDRFGVRRSYWSDNWVDSYHLTRGFVAAVRCLTDTTSLDELMKLREMFTTQWLEEFISSLSEKAKRKIYGDQQILIRISKARNRDPREVAAFVNHGIYSNIYTYLNNFVTPEQARAIYDGYNGESNAKVFIESSVPIGRVIRELRS